MPTPSTSITNYNSKIAELIIFQLPDLSRLIILQMKRISTHYYPYNNYHYKKILNVRDESPVTLYFTPLSFLLSPQPSPSIYRTNASRMYINTSTPGI